MTDLLISLLKKENEEMFESICKKFFDDYGRNKGYLTKTEFRRPINEITNELYNIKLNNNTSDLIYDELDKTGKGKLLYDDFKGIAKCLILSLINYSERVNDSSSFSFYIDQFDNFPIYKSTNEISSITNETNLNKDIMLQIPDDIDLYVEELYILDEYILTQYCKKSINKIKKKRKSSSN